VYKSKEVSDAIASGVSDAQIEEVKKSLFNNGETSSSVGLHTAIATEFIAEVFSQSEVLKNAQVAIMDTPRQIIPVVDIVPMGEDGEVATPRYYDGGTKDGENSMAVQEIEMVSKDIIVPWSLSTQEIQDNVEGAALVGKVLGAFTTALANQIESDSLYARAKTVKKSADLNAGEVPENLARIRDMMDGVITTIEKTGNVVDLADTTRFADRYVNSDILIIAKNAVPQAFVGMVDACYMPNTVLSQYKNEYAKTMNTISPNDIGGSQFIVANLLRTNRPVFVSGGANTTLSATALRGATTISVTSATGISAGDVLTLALGQAKEASFRVASVSGTTVTLASLNVGTFSGLPYQYNSGLSTENTVKETVNDGVDILLTPKNNIVYGIHSNIRVETLRVPRSAMTEYVMSMRYDVKLINPQKCVLIKNAKMKTGTV
jgi:hypothetical protein